MARFDKYLQELSGAIDRCHGSSVIVAGDFNAKITEWESPRTTARGEALVEWVATLDLRLVNRGREGTSISWNGSSIVDLTWASSDVAARIRDWRTHAEVESLFDHNYITMRIGGETRRNGAEGATRDRGPRWALGTMDEESFRAAVEMAEWSKPTRKLRASMAEGAS